MTETKLGNQVYQFPGETDKEFAYFMVYVLLPSPRRLQSIADHFGKSASWASKLAKKNKWLERVVENENDAMVSLALKRDEQLADRAKEIADKRIVLAGDAVTLVEREFKKHIEMSEGTDAPICSIPELAKLADIATKISRLENGEPLTIKQVNETRNVNHHHNMEINVPAPPMLKENFDDSIEEAEFTIEELEEMTPE